MGQLWPPWQRVRTQEDREARTGKLGVEDSILGYAQTIGFQYSRFAGQPQPAVFSRSIPRPAIVAMDEWEPWMSFGSKTLKKNRTWGGHVSSGAWSAA